MGSGTGQAHMLEHDRLYVIDGAMATELERRGADINDRLWSAKVLIENPQLIEQVHHAYLSAGADIILSASYQASFDGFAARGLDAATARALLGRSVELARAARERYLSCAAGDPQRARPLIGASMGAYGAHRHDGSEYHGNYGVPSRLIREFHCRQLEVLAATGADFIAFETVPSLAEAETIVRLLEDFDGVHAWISFSCRDALHVGHGERFAVCAALAEEHEGIFATGINCTAPQFVESLLEAASAATTRALFAYPNSGESWNAAEGSWHGENCATGLASWADRWLTAGARMLGGCCRTGPEDIRALARAMRGRS